MVVAELLAGVLEVEEGADTTASLLRRRPGRAELDCVGNALVGETEPRPRPVASALPLLCPLNKNDASDDDSPDDNDTANDTPEDDGVLEGVVVEPVRDQSQDCQHGREDDERSDEREEAADHSDSPRRDVCRDAPLEEPPQWRPDEQDAHIAAEVFLEKRRLATERNPVVVPPGVPRIMADVQAVGEYAHQTLLSFRFRGVKPHAYVQVTESNCSIFRPRCQELL